jgi:hypothetical protein
MCRRPPLGGDDAARVYDTNYYHDGQDDTDSASSAASDFVYTGTPSAEYHAMRAAYEACATKCYFGEFRAFHATRTYVNNGLTNRGSEREELAAANGDLASFIEAARQRQVRQQQHDAPRAPMKAVRAATRARDNAGPAPGYAAQPAGQRAIFSLGQDSGSASASTPGPRLTGTGAETDAPAEPPRPSRSQRRNANRRHRASGAKKTGSDAAP